MVFGARPIGTRSFGDSAPADVLASYESLQVDFVLNWDVEEREDVIVDMELVWDIHTPVQVDTDLRWDVRVSLIKDTQLWWQMAVRPSQELLTAIYESGSKVIRYIEIYEANGTALYRGKTAVDLVDGSVNYDNAREERAACQLTLANIERDLQVGPGGFWYDKVIRVYRGVEYLHDLGGFLGNETRDGVTTLGTFMIDEIKTQRHPQTIEITGRDFSKKLKLSKFKRATSYAQGSKLEDVIRAIAISGGIPASGMTDLVTHVTLDRDYVFESGVERWSAIQEIVRAHGWQAWFSKSGILQWQVYFDPAEFDEFYHFSTGWDGEIEVSYEENLVDYSRNRRDVRVYNVVLVTGESANGPLISAEAVNNNVNSPTSVAKLGERLYKYSSPMITSQAQAQALADKLLLVQGLEEFDVSLQSVVMPWVNPGDVVRFTEEFSFPGEPTRFILSNVTIPLGLQPMDVTLKKIVNVSGLF